MLSGRGGFSIGYLNTSYLGGDWTHVEAVIGKEAAHLVGEGLFCILWFGQCSCFMCVIIFRYYSSVGH